ncbi:MAG: hypothetical protein MRJ65_14470 [Candidatus Brocadiaceae bacterium]|nr:hypothetical protein [Candidatus Brocadiaceae bacterium]
MLKIGAFITILLLCCSSHSISPANTTYKIPKGAVKEQLENVMKYTQRGIILCIHDFAALDIADELERARNRGLRIQIAILDRGNGMGTLSAALLRKGFDVRVFNQKPGNAWKQDFIMIDDSILITGVYNWLAYQDRIINNDARLYYGGDDKIQSCKQTFYRIFTEGKTISFEDQRKEPPAPPITTQKSREHSTIGEDTKDFINVSFEELDDTFGEKSTLSRSQKKEMWKRYEGKYVRWRGIITHKGMGRVDWNRVGVSRQKESKAEVEILVGWQMFDRVMSERIGNEITYTGKLFARPGYNSPFRLKDGNLE